MASILQVMSVEAADGVEIVVWWLNQIWRWARQGRCEELGDLEILLWISFGALGSSEWPAGCPGRASVLARIDTVVFSVSFISHVFLPRFYSFLQSEKFETWPTRHLISPATGAFVGVQAGLLIWAGSHRGAACRAHPGPIL